MAYGIIEDGDGEQIRPPTGPLSAEINRTSPLSRGLIRLFAPAAREYKGKSKGLIALGSSSIIKNTSLITASSAGTTSTIGLLGGMSGAAAYTMLAIATPSSLTTRMPLLGYDWYYGIPHWGFGTGYGDSSQVYAQLDSSNYTVETTPGFFVAGERHLYAMTASNSAGVTFYKDKTASVGTIVGSFVNAPAIPAQSLSAGGGHLNGAGVVSSAWEGAIELVAYWDRVLSAFEIARIVDNPWQLFEADNDPVFYSLASGSNNTGTLSSTLDATTLTGVGNVTRSATLAVTLDAATLAGTGTAAVTNKTGTLAVTLDAATLAGVGAVTRRGTLAVTLDAATLAGVGSVAVGSNREGTLASTLAAATLAGIGGAARSATLAVTLDAATLTGVGTAGQPRIGTLAVTLDNVTLSGVGAIPAAPSHGGGSGTGRNLSRKQKKKLKAVESQEWLKAEETARQLLNDRFTKQTPQEKAQALETHIESLTPVIEALKAITDQIEDVQETVQETKTEELTEHKQILNKFDALITKMTSIEELLIIMLAQ